MCRSCSKNSSQSSFLSRSYSPFVCHRLITQFPHVLLCLLLCYHDVCPLSYYVLHIILCDARFLFPIFSVLGGLLGLFNCTPVSDCMPLSVRPLVFVLVSHLLSPPPFSPSPTDCVQPSPQSRCPPPPNKQLILFCRFVTL